MHRRVSLRYPPYGLRPNGIMTRLSHSVSKFRFATISLTAAAGLLLAAYLAVLEWRQGAVCREFRSVYLTAEGLWFILPWIVIIVCQFVTMRRPKFEIAFYASFVLSLTVVLVEIDSLPISWIQGRGFWMPGWLFCDQGNWVDFTLPIAILTGFITAPFAGVFGLATVIGISWRWLEISQRRRE